MKIDINDIKKLREMTSAGVGDCRTAMEESKGDIKKAVEWLTKRGLEKAAKKGDREVFSGRVFCYVHHTGRVGAMVSLACETDFVAKNEEFEKLGKELALQAAATMPESVEEFEKQEYVRNSSKTVEQLVKETIGRIGENMRVVDVKIVKI